MFDFLFRKSWQDNLREMGYKGSFTTRDLVEEICQYDHENMGVMFRTEGSMIVATITYNVEAGNSNKAVDQTHTGWMGEGRSAEEAAADLLLKLLRKYGRLGWESLFTE